MTIEKIIQEDNLFIGKKDITYEPLNGGLSNETFLVTCEGISYVVKIHFKQNQYLHVTRKTESLAQVKAAQLGISPKVLSDPENEDYMISEFVQGHMMTKEEIIEQENIVKLAGILKKVHTIKGVERNFSVFHMIDGYTQGISEFKVSLPNGYEDILKEAYKIQKKREADTTNVAGYCHNDFLNNNLLFDNGKICLIDWELSGIGDIYMDLATLPYQYNFDKKMEKLLLESYFGYYDEEMSMQLWDMKYIGMVREMLWGLFFSGLNQKSVNHDANYYEMGCYVADRLNKGLRSF